MTYESGPAGAATPLPTRAADARQTKKLVRRILTVEAVTVECWQNINKIEKRFGAFKLKRVCKNENIGAIRLRKE